MPFNSALSQLYGTSPAETPANPASPDQGPSPEPPHPSRLHNSSVLAALTLMPPPSAAELARLLAGKPRRRVEELLARLRADEQNLVMDHLGNSTGWDPACWQESPGDENPYLQETMFRPETCYPDSGVQIRRLLALDLVENYKTLLAAGLEARIRLWEELLAAFHQAARQPQPEWEERIRNAGAHYKMTTLEALPNEAEPSSYYEKAARSHAVRARQAIDQARQDQK